MKAILIDPNMKSVARIDISKDALLSDHFGEKPQVAAKLPKGDAAPLSIGLPTVMKHLDVLARAGLIERRKTGRTVAVTLVPDAMQQHRAVQLRLSGLGLGRVKTPFLGSR